MVSKIQTMGKFNDPTTTSFRVFKIAVRGGGGKFSAPSQLEFLLGGIFLLGEGNLRIPCGLQLYFNLVPKETSTQFMNSFFFLWNTCDGCFCQFDKVTVQ